jgi:Tfp pilus assembly protein PilF
MRVAILLAVCGLAAAQPPDPAYEPLTQAFEALNARNYQAAVTSFLNAIQAAPQRASIHKDLAYAYLKTGENSLARAQFGEAMRLEPGDAAVAMEYAFLCFESKNIEDKAQARRIFDRLQKAGNDTAGQAFRNIDGPLAEGIARWQEAIRRGADEYGAHFELASLAEQRGDLELAEEHYRKAWKLRPDRRAALVDLGRVWKQMGRPEQAASAFLSASRGADARTAEMARDQLPARYPYVHEFRLAVELDPQNLDLRRELAYLLLQMGHGPEAEKEFRALADAPWNDLLSAAQLGFLLYDRGERAAAKVLLDRVLAGPDKDLANRVRSVLGLPLTGHLSPGEADPKDLADLSIKSGYLKDALYYLKQAHAANPSDYGVLLKMGWTANILHQDSEAFRWFGQTRKSDDPKIADAANQAWRNLRPAQEFLQVSGWLYPLFSTRWRDLFGYGQLKAEIRTKLPIRPYLSVRLDGDARSGTLAMPGYLSQTSLIFSIGVRTLPWHGITGWFEAGSAANYLTGHMLPDYRGGMSATRSLGRSLNGEFSGWFAELNCDGIFLSRFGNDFLVYGQTRTGYTAGPKAFRSQIFWSANLTFDSARQVWANFAETGPGARFHSTFMPSSMYLMFNVLRGGYLAKDGIFMRPAYTDLRLGVWYAFVR